MKWIILTIALLPFLLLVVVIPLYSRYDSVFLAALALAVIAMVSMVVLPPVRWLSDSSHAHIEAWDKVSDDKTILTVELMIIYMAGGCWLLLWLLGAFYPAPPEGVGVPMQALNVTIHRAARALLFIGGISVWLCLGIMVAKRFIR